MHHFASRWAREANKSGLRPAQSKEEQDRNPPVEHPMIRTHPETGEPAMYAGGFAVRVAGLPQEESEALLDGLEQWFTRSGYVYRHRWRLHDLVFWDNRRVMHHATEYPEDMRRHMHRTTVKGNAPYFAAAEPGSIAHAGALVDAIACLEVLDLGHPQQVEELLEVATSPARPAIVPVSFSVASTSFAARIAARMTQFG